MAHGASDGGSGVGDHPTQQADDKVSQSGEYPGVMTSAHLGAVFNILEPLLTLSAAKQRKAR